MQDENDKRKITDEELDQAAGGADLDDTAQVYVAYDTTSSDHLYTTDLYDLHSYMQPWKAEAGGVEHYTPAQFYHPESPIHIYNPENCPPENWQPENHFYSDDANKAVPVYRVYNPNCSNPLPIGNESDQGWRPWLPEEDIEELRENGWDTSNETP